MTTALTRRYRLFGLTIDSELELPELSETETEEDRANIFIRADRGQDESNGFILDVEDVARFRISNGRSITIARHDGAGDREVRLFLLGSAMGIALHQRGLLPLHANAVEIGGKAVAFMGQSGSGKSTLAAWFHDQGFRILADDVCVVRTTSDGVPMAYPGLPRLRLWQDALEASGRTVGEHPLSCHVDADERRKYDVRIGDDSIAADAIPLKSLFVLEKGESFAIERLRGTDVVEAISANTYRGEYIYEVGDMSAHFAACTRLAREVPVFRCVRPFDRASIDEPAASILAFCQSI